LTIRISNNALGGEELGRRPWEREIVGSNS
jgi:hypothetical protein